MSTHSIRLCANHDLSVKRVVIAGFSHVSQQYFAKVFDPKMPHLLDTGGFRCLQKLREFIESHGVTAPDTMLEYIFEDSDIQTPQRDLVWSKDGAILKSCIRA
jgi:hypothetical protein